MERLTDRQTDRQTNGKETALRTDTDVDFRLCVFFVRFPIRLEQTPPGSRPPLPGAMHASRYRQQAGGAHPTGMHTCFCVKFRVHLV